MQQRSRKKQSFQFAERFAAASVGINRLMANSNECREALTRVETKKDDLLNELKTICRNCRLKLKIQKLPPLRARGNGFAN
jgi:hypothetical protein